MPAAMSSSKSITVSIVSHGQQELIVPLLEQLEAHSAHLIAKVVLTVNIPEQEALMGTAWRFPMERIANAAPRGFGSNHNAAFAQCGSPWFLVLNPDIRLADDVLGAVLAEARPDSGVLTPRIMEPGASEPEPHRALLTPWEILQRHKSDYRSPAFPSWIPGMFMLFRADAYREIRGFDTRYFMYGEDFDICARLRLHGWQIRVAEHLRVRHEAQRASRRNWQHLRWHFTSLARLWLSATFWRYRALPTHRISRNP